MTERLHFHFSLSCTGEGNGNPLRCACLENPRDGGAWWAAAYGVAQGQTRLKRLSQQQGPDNASCTEESRVVRKTDKYLVIFHKFLNIAMLGANSIN